MALMGAVPVLITNEPCAKLNYENTVKNKTMTSDNFEYHYFLKYLGNFSIFQKASGYYEKA